MNKVYAVQNALNAEIKLSEHNLETKVNTAHQDIQKMILDIQEAKQKKMESEGNCQKISEAIALANKNFEEEGITKEMTPESKVA